MTWDHINPKTKAVIKNEIRRIFRRSKEKRDFLSTVTVYEKIANRKRAFVHCSDCNKKCNKASKEYQIDHVLPVGTCSPNMVALMFDSRNLQILCTSCHDKKTEIDREDIARRKLL